MSEPIEAAREAGRELFRAHGTPAYTELLATAKRRWLGTEYWAELLDGWDYQAVLDTHPNDWQSAGPDGRSPSERHRQIHRIITKGDST